MQKEGLFSRYAIGGGIASLFYIEPITTFDLDIFILPPESSDLIFSMSPIYTWLEKKGYISQKEQVVIEGVPVQLIPVYNELVKDAVHDSIEKKYKDTTTFVLRSEYLVAIMIQTNRSKDRERLDRFLKEAEISLSKLNDILIRYNLKVAYDTFRGAHLGK